MDKHLSNIWTASAELEMIQFRNDRAHERLVQALCEAMAARISPAAAAAAANLSLSELFDTLRRRRTTPTAEKQQCGTRRVSPVPPPGPAATPGPVPRTGAPPRRGEGRSAAP